MAGRGLAIAGRSLAAATQPGAPLETSPAAGAPSQRPGQRQGRLVAALAQWARVCREAAQKGSGQSSGRHLAQQRRARRWYGAAGMRKAHARVCVCVGGCTLSPGQ
mmetsp:Transcript_17210/g.51694  ORF Transcript_17210/g.51694 Transcript_17210/m.51694 type:complete len:106 (-) Transcript_17210:74-391(-)|eukprot:353858-Chlamydomonas_euryale.AAC.7